MFIYARKEKGGYQKEKYRIFFNFKTLNFRSNGEKEFKVHFQEVSKNNEPSQVYKLNNKDVRVRYAQLNPIVNEAIIPKDFNVSDSLLIDDRYILATNEIKHSSQTICNIVDLKTRQYIEEIEFMRIYRPQKIEYLPEYNSVSKKGLKEVLMQTIQKFQDKNEIEPKRFDQSM